MASTSFLTLTNRLLRRLNEVEISQSDFASARGVQSMAKDAINASIDRIQQSAFTWPFNATSGSQVLTVGQEEYAFPTDLKIVDWRSFHISRDDTLGQYGRSLKFISRDIWYKNLKTGDDYSGSDGLNVPLYVFEKHGSGFSVSPSPNQEYTVTFDYWIDHTRLSDYSDTSTIPPNYDEVIIQGALYHFYMFRDNSQQAQIADESFKNLLQHMRTILINKEDRIRSSMVGNVRYIGVPSEPLYPL